MKSATKTTPSSTTSNPAAKGLNPNILKMLEDAKKNGKPKEVEASGSIEDYRNSVVELLKVSIKRETPRVVYFTERTRDASSVMPALMTRQEYVGNTYLSDHKSTVGDRRVGAAVRVIGQRLQSDANGEPIQDEDGNYLFVEDSDPNEVLMDLNLYFGSKFNSKEPALTIIPGKTDGLPTKEVKAANGKTYDNADWEVNPSLEGDLYGPLRAAKESDEGELWTIVSEFIPTTSNFDEDTKDRKTLKSVTGAGAKEKAPSKAFQAPPEEGEEA